MLTLLNDILNIDKGNKNGPNSKICITVLITTINSDPSQINYYCTNDYL